MNKTLILPKIYKLKQYWENNLIPTLKIHEVHPELPLNDRINYVYFTLPVSLNFQRSSPAMWQAALKTYDDPDTNYLFYPEKVVQTSREKVQVDLAKHKLSLQKNKHTDIWMNISKTFTEIFEKYDYDIVKIITALQIGEKKNFPFLSGIKLSNYWLFILSKFTDIQLVNQHEISIIPDTHIIKSSIHLGIVPEDTTPLKVELAWKELLKDSGISPVEMHPILWNWSRADFKQEV